MARRTRKEKQGARHVYAPSYIYTEKQTQESGVVKEASGKVAVAIPPSYLDTDTSLIKNDIIRSVLISGLILMIEFSIYWYWYK